MLFSRCCQCECVVDEEAYRNNVEDHHMHQKLSYCLERTIQEASKMTGSKMTSAIVLRERLFFVQRCIDLHDTDGLLQQLVCLSNRQNLVPIKEEH